MALSFEIFVDFWSTLRSGPRPYLVEEKDGVLAAVICDSAQGLGRAEMRSRKAAPLFVERLHAGPLDENTVHTMFAEVDRLVGSGRDPFHAVLARIQNGKLDLAFRGACGGRLLRAGGIAAQTWEMRLMPKQRPAARPSAHPVVVAGQHSNVVFMQAGNKPPMVVQSSRVHHPVQQAPELPKADKVSILNIVDLAAEDTLVLYSSNIAKTFHGQGGISIPAWMAPARMTGLIASRASFLLGPQPDRVVAIVDIKGEAESTGETLH